MVAAVELGILLHTARQVRDDTVTADLSGVVEAAAQAEVLGVGRVWFGDSSRMERGWPRADFATMLAAVSTRTERVGVGVVPLSAPLRNPVLLAHELATIDVLSRGRLVVAPSIGKGGAEGEREFLNCGIPFGERGRRLSEMLQVLPRLWTETSVTFEGQFYRLVDASIFPKPRTRPIPLMVATGRDLRALERAGRYGNGWFCSGVDIDTFREDRRKVSEFARKHGRTEADVAPTGLLATVHLERDGFAAQDEGPRYMERYFGTHSPGAGGSHWFGSPDGIADRLKQFAEAGLTNFVARFVDDDLDKQMTLLRSAVERSGT